MKLRCWRHTILLTLVTSCCGTSQESDEAVSPVSSTTTSVSENEIFSDTFGNGNEDMTMTVQAAQETLTEVVLESLKNEPGKAGAHDRAENDNVVRDGIDELPKKASHNGNVDLSVLSKTAVVTNTLEVFPESAKFHGKSTQPSNVEYSVTSDGNSEKKKPEVAIEKIAEEKTSFLNESAMNDAINLNTLVHETNAENGEKKEKKVHDDGATTQANIFSLTDRKSAKTDEIQEMTSNNARQGEMINIPKQVPPFLSKVPAEKKESDSDLTGSTFNAKPLQSQTMEIYQNKVLISNIMAAIDAETVLEKSLNKGERDVIQLTTRNFDFNVSDGNLWLVEFYAPWCSHCHTFHATYQEVAAYFHTVYNNENSGKSNQKQPKRKVKVARIDGDAEQALASRFAVNSFPSFFVLDGWSVYVFQATRSRKSLIDFASGGYKDTLSPSSTLLPWYSSPMGPLGLVQGSMIQVGFLLADIFQYLQDKMGLAPLLAGGLMFATAFLGCFFFIVFLAIVITPKAKVD